MSPILKEMTQVLSVILLSYVLVGVMSVTMILVYNAIWKNAI